MAGHQDGRMRRRGLAKVLVQLIHHPVDKTQLPSCTGIVIATPCNSAACWLVNQRRRPASKIPDIHILVIWLSLAAPSDLLYPHTQLDPSLLVPPLVVFWVHWFCFGATAVLLRGQTGPTAGRTCKSFVWVSLHFCHASLPRYGQILFENLPQSELYYHRPLPIYKRISSTSPLLLQGTTLGKWYYINKAPSAAKVVDTGISCRPICLSPFILKSRLQSNSDYGIFWESRIGPIQLKKIKFRGINCQF